MAGDEVLAFPTKSFFVKMLTRDIELRDAILDLIDNCVDGVHRQLRDQSKVARAKSDAEGAAEMPFEGYWARVTATTSKFIIEDNCGGIPKVVAQKSAFMLGRPDTERDKDIPTVGMYGIGMKRAIFKMGQHCVVTSQPATGAFRVEITPKWLEDDKNWKLELMEDEDGLEEDGTSVRIEKLFPQIKQQFDPKASSFLSELALGISQLFARIITKGFRIYLNSDDPIKPVDLTLLFPTEANRQAAKSIRPYVFKGKIKGVEVELSVGFYRPLASQHELDEEDETPRTRETAGWTVVCNDRVVLYADKTAVTGWGVGQVPRYHNQFIAIAGFASFRSNDSWKLPLNTTKRGLDTSSEVYLVTLEFMKEGLKKFTTFTNRWKTREDETGPEFAGAVKTTAREIQALVDDDDMSSVRNLPPQSSGRKFVPNLPLPTSREAMVRLTFSRPPSQVEAVAEYLFGDPKADRSEVAADCFDRVLKEAGE